MRAFIFNKETGELAQGKSWINKNGEAVRDNALASSNDDSLIIIEKTEAETKAIEEQLTEGKKIVLLDGDVGFADIEKEQVTQGFTEKGGNFFGRLPMVTQGDVRDLVKTGDRSAETLFNYIMSGGDVNTASLKTQGGVMYLAGMEIPDETGEVHQLDKPIITMKMAQDWLVGNKVVYEAV